MVNKPRKPADDAPIDEPPTDEPELPYLLGTWHGMTQYRCRECPFDALEEETGSGLVLVADKNGNLK
jgi:hypothetical protein